MNNEQMTQAVLQWVKREADAERGPIYPLDRGLIGSRARKMETADSDFDIRVIYRRLPQDYVSAFKINKITKSMQDGIVDVSGWDLPTFMYLIWSSDPNALEYVFAQEPTKLSKFYNRLRAIATEVFDPQRGFMGFRGLAVKYNHNLREYFRGFDQIGVERRDQMRQSDMDRVLKEIVTGLHAAYTALYIRYTLAPPIVNYFDLSMACKAHTVIPSLTLHNLVVARSSSDVHAIEQAVRSSMREYDTICREVNAVAGELVVHGHDEPKKMANAKIVDQFVFDTIFGDDNGN